MKWFIKGIMHYADFSGRARRKEFWMFILFYMIFNLIWTISLTVAYSQFVPSLISRKTNFVIGAYYLSYFSYLAIMTLPFLAMVVRRLHDLGKSGWMFLITLIPIAGSIWLFILMLTEGQQENNKYGDNPKTSRVLFSVESRLKSMGITLIVASIVLLPYTITIPIRWLYSLQGQMIFNKLHLLMPKILSQIPDVLAVFMLTAAGIIMLNKKELFNNRKRDKIAFIILIISAFFYFVMTFSSLIRLVPRLNFFTAITNLFLLHVMESGYFFDNRSVPGCLFDMLRFLAIILLLLKLLSKKNCKNINIFAFITIILSSISLLLTTHERIMLYSNWWLHGIKTPVNYMITSMSGILYIFSHIAFIVFACTFITKTSIDAEKKPE